MTANQLRIPIAVGLAAALLIVALGVFDALSLALFLAVLFWAGLISAVLVAFGDGTTPPSVEHSSVEINEYSSQKWRPPEPEDSRPEEAGGAAAV